MDGQRVCLGARKRDGGVSKQLELEELENRSIPPDRLGQALFPPSCLSWGLMRELRVWRLFAKCAHPSAPGQANGVDKQ